MRYTAVALGYNACLAVTGGTMPLVATRLVNRTSNEISPALLIMAAAIASFLALLRTAETFRKPLECGDAGTATVSRV